MMVRVIAAIAMAALGALMLGGCSTVFHGSAPSAQAGMEYVAGTRGGSRTIWLCPVGAANGECHRVEVTD